MAMRRTGRHAVERRFWIIRGAAAILLLAVAVLAATLAGRLTGHSVRLSVTRDAAETLNVQAAVLEGILDKYRLLTPLLSGTREIASILAPPGSPLIAVNARDAARAVGQVTAMSGALDAALFSPSGELVASARGRFQPSASALDAALAAARQGRLGRQSLKLADGEKAYLFASQVRRQGKVLGYIAILVGFESVESTWALSKKPIFVTDRNGEILLTNRPTGEIASLAPAALSGDLVNGTGETFIELSRSFPLLEWEVHVLADTRPIALAVTWATVSALLFVLLLAVATALLIRRSEQVILRERRDRAIALSLERRVRTRTKALSEVNGSLAAEVEERRIAEEKLRQAQSDLVHTARLAGLGQMAAALGHEFNQPIAAIRTYADNAARLIAREEPRKAEHNLSRIAAMTERMAELSKTLLAFARKPRTTTEIIGLGPVLDEAMILVRPRLRKAEIDLVIDPALREHTVLGGKVRLSQVFINLINNAADAMSHLSGGRIEIAIGQSAGGDDLTIEVADDGPGIPEDIARQIFEPFVTTKSSGEGIGIGLSIVSNILADFGGGIRLLRTGPEGTVFAITLRNADSQSIAAE
ncbi:sensor histidine kinase [Fulvimarina endophytica]|uniref:C4-dicarboxylate transport sensor protein DctB n=1 Tax=Fulvimarina endophytica TaxID=2293836 RepID=A0A371X7M4_9HYPH|nr:ATP-binding protein [Fulvimarina endophytica]RFC65223.1 sensor histidine kinase [Fulvimarina endophytica]